jgi:hypothetical protein
MEANHKNNHGSRDSNEHHGMEEIDMHIDKNVSGKDITDEGMEDRRHHQSYGNRKYESYRNHSSADDQPQVNTDLNPERGRN